MFQELQRDLNSLHATKIDMSNKHSQLYLQGKCSDINFPPLNFTVMGYDIPVPMKFYSNQTTSDRCDLMVKLNQDQRVSPIILGVPFLRAYSLFFKFDNHGEKQIGLGTKITHPEVRIGGFTPRTIPIDDNSGVDPSVDPSVNPIVDPNHDQHSNDG